uniref:Uncharacterized protein n=1 Tax=Populus trichocarpa TaxID=3694 RepID=A0A3N7HDE8_POPTR
MISSSLTIYSACETLKSIHLKALLCKTQQLTDYLRQINYCPCGFTSL